MNILKRLMAWLLNRKGMGLIPQPEDKRDWKYQLSGETLVEVDLFKNDLPIRNQGRFNSCVGHSAGYVLSRLIDSILPEDEFYDKYSLVSEAFIWVMAKYDEGSITNNDGVIARNAFKSISKHGFLSRHSFDFKDGVYKLPDMDKLELANIYKILLNYLPEYYGINRYYTKRMQYIKNALSNGSHISLAIPIYSNFNNHSGGIISENTGTFKGYHDVVIGGYYESVEEGIIFKGRNSWGTNWGERGYFRITEDYLFKNAFDIWTLQ